MGFVEYYIIVLFCMGALVSMYYTGKGDKMVDPASNGRTSIWLVVKNKT